MLFFALSSETQGLSLLCRVGPDGFMGCSLIDKFVKNMLFHVTWVV